MTKRHEVTNRLIELLTNHVGHPVGDTDAPSDADESYCIVYPIDGGAFEGPIRDPNELIDFVYQVTSVGRTREQAEWVADRVRHVMLARKAKGGGLQYVLIGVADREPDGGPGGVEREGTPPNAVYSVADRYRLKTTGSVT